MPAVVIVVLSLSAPIFGQPVVALRWGGNMSKIGGSLHQGPPRKTMRIGASVNIPIKNRISLQAYADYARKGSDKDYIYYYHIGLLIDYIELSGLGVFKIFAPSRGPSLSILAGPTIAFKIKNRGEEIMARRYGQGQTVNNSEAKIYSFYFKTIDLGLAGGIGTQMKIFGPLIVTADILYTRSIRPINKTTFYDIAGDMPEEHGLTNFAFSACVGIGVELGR